MQLRGYPSMNTAHCCDTYTNFAGVWLWVLANQLIPFYIVNPFLKDHSDAMGNFKN
jgi:hypothetical protein